MNQLKTMQGTKEASDPMQMQISTYWWAQTARPGHQYKVWIRYVCTSRMEKILSRSLILFMSLEEAMVADIKGCHWDITFQQQYGHNKHISDTDSIADLCDSTISFIF